MILDAVSGSSVAINGLSMSDTDDSSKRRNRRRRDSSDPSSDSDNDRIMTQRRKARRKRIDDDEEEVEEERGFPVAEVNGGEKSRNARLGKPKRLNSFDSGDDNGAVSTTKSDRASIRRNTSTKRSRSSPSASSSPVPPRTAETSSRHSRPTSRQSKTTEDFTIKKKPKKPIEGYSSLLDNMPAPPPPPPEEPPKKPKSSLSTPLPAPAPTLNKKRKDTAKAAPSDQLPSTKDLKLQNFLAQQQQTGSTTTATIARSLDHLCNSVSVSLPTNSGRIDLFGSFLDPSDDHDFFDRNEDGDVVIQPSVPLFPEEFSAGQREHSLSWWGVLDPKVAASSQSESNNGRSNRDPSGRDRRSRT